MSTYGAGTATFSAAGVISSVSDERLKIDDGLITNGIDKIKALIPRYFYFKKDQKENGEKYGDRQLGFFAQEVNKIIPEAAPTPEEGKYYGIYDRAINAVTVQAMKDLIERVEKLENGNIK
jgi:hypothetical protein